LMVRLVIASLIFLTPLLLARIPAIGLDMAAQGETWQPCGLQGETVLALEVTGSGAERAVYAETRTGLWRYAATDSTSHALCGGQSWRHVDAGLPVTPLGGPALAAWRTVPGRAAGFYALTGAGTARQIFRSDDGGDTWQLIGPAPGQLERPPMVVLAGANGAPDSITLVGDSRVQRSTDGGQTWVPGGAWPAPGSKAEPDRPVGQPPAVRHTIHRLLGESNAPDRLYALADDGAFWLSESGGRAWRIISAPIAAPADSGIGGAAASRPVTALALVPYFGVRIWATTADAIGFSTDNGANWTVQPLPLIASPEKTGRSIGVGPGAGILLADPRVPETVYAALGQIVYRSDDAGATWTSLGHAGGGQITALALDPDTRSVLYAAGDDGVWMRRVVPISPAALAAMPTEAPTETAPVPTPTRFQSPTASFTATPTETALLPTETATPQPNQTHTPTVTASPSPTRPPTATRPPTPTPPPSPTAVPPTVGPPVATAPPPPTAEPRPTATPQPPTAEPPTAESRPTALPSPETPRPTPVPR
jgi:photosystem II stability/assembly factor-like uncharacterized protein